jgi:outer membrane protein W
MRSPKLALLISLAAVGSAFAATYDNTDKMNIVRGGALYSSPSGDMSAGGVTLEPDTAAGIQASYERKLNDLLGVNVNISHVNYDINAKGFGQSAKFAEQAVTPLGVNVLFHPPIGVRKLDWYVGPELAYVVYNDAEVESTFGGGTVDTDNDTAFGVKTGLDVGLGQGNWGLNFDVQYLKTSSDDLDIDPISVGAGLSVHF